MITISGRLVYPGNGIAPSLYDVGWGLARTGRFSGQMKHWYPVLPHTFAVADLVSPDAKLHAMLHDAAESVLGDQVATWKNDQTKNDEIEILYLIYEELGLSWSVIPQEIHDEVLAADLACRSAEALLLGHAAPNEEFFQEIRMANPTLFQSALDRTRRYMVTFTGTICLDNTDWCAREFEKEVMSWLQRTKSIQEMTA